MRAIDANGDAGSWNDGQPFTESFDQSAPTIQNLHVYDQNGDVLTNGFATNNDPILRWSPVPGASEYQLTLASWLAPGQYPNPSSTTGECDWNAPNGAGTATITTRRPPGRLWVSTAFQIGSRTSTAGRTAPTTPIT